MPKRLQILPEKCTGCMQCELACSWVQTGTFRPSRSLVRVQIFDDRASYAPYTCVQCDEAWCMTACPVNAITLTPSHGTVVIAEFCIGCALCTIACPFGTIYFSPDTDTAVKCDLCAGDPACVHACPTGAIEHRDHPGADWLGPWAASLAALPTGGQDEHR